MTKENFEALAQEYGQDTYGEIDSECGWGVNFTFELAQALHFYLPLYWDSQWDEKYSAYCTVEKDYHNPYQNEIEEGGIAEMIFSDMEADEEMWKEIFEAYQFGITLF